MNTMLRRGAGVGLIAVGLGCARANPAFDDRADSGDDVTGASTVGVGETDRPDATTEGSASGTGSATTTPTDPSGVADTGLPATSGTTDGDSETGTNACLPGDAIAVQLAPTADTYLVDLVDCGECANTNYGAAQSHPIGFSKPFGDAVMLLRFDDAQPQPLATASLRLTVEITGAPPGGALMYVDIFADSCGWQEGTGPLGDIKGFVGSATYNDCDTPNLPWAGGDYAQEASLTVATEPLPPSGAALLDLEVPLDPEGIEQWLLSGSRTLMVSVGPIAEAIVDVRSRESSDPPSLVIEYCK